MPSLEQLQTAALEHVDNAVMITAVDGTILWVNRAFTTMSGYRADEAVGATPRLLRSGAQDEAYYAGLWSTILAGRTWRGEVVNRRKDGHLYTVVQSIMPIADEQGSIRHFVAVHDDVSTLRFSQAHLQALFDNALDAILLFDDEGRLVEANPAVCALTGHTVDQLAARTLQELVPDVVRDRFVRRWAGLLEEGQGRGTMPITRRDGTQLEVEYQAVAGIAPGVNLLIARDVTAARRAEAEQRFQAQLLDAVGEAVIATDRDGVVRYLNPAAERLYGWREVEALGRPIVEVNVPLDAPGARERAEDIMAQVQAGEAWSGELEVRRRDGSTFPALVTSAPYVDEDGAVAGTIGVSADISDVKRANRLLERRAAQQTAVAEVGKHALTTDDPHAIALYAARRTSELLGDELDAEIVWADERDAEPGARSGTWRFPIGETAELVVRGRDGAELEAHDRGFVQSMAHLIHSAVHRDAANARLAHLATRDPVTDLPNRTLLLDRLEQTRASVQRSGKRFAVLMLGLDGFKFVNDGFGHDIGDEVLRLVADRLQGVLRPTDTLARFGGDEFTVLCPEVSGEQAAVALAKRLQGALTAPLRVEQAELTVTASIGIALGGRADQGSALLRDVDTAMYWAKERGRNRIEVFDVRMHERSRHRLDVTAALRTALAEGGIVVVYQPTIELAAGRIVGVEALARLRLPSGELISPNQFIPIAEETGHIAAVGRQVLEQACLDAVPWTRARTGFLVSVNVSPRQFTHHDLIETVGQVLAGTALEPAGLCLEITESAALSDPGVHSAMSELRRRGITLAIDDFGTGYSSLSHLQRMPVDILKIDRSFVSGMVDNPQDRALVAAAIELARTFDLTTTAEGVETSDQRAALTALGCELAQGYLWSRPVDAADITALLDSADPAPR
jgi:diguanylate cyclase (GGDEF)-like protein/PAS domain S-box-containing protein